MDLIALLVAAYLLPLVGLILVLWGGIGAIRTKRSKHPYRVFLVIGGLLLMAGIGAFVNLSQINFAL
ncbi:hypothetical protein [Pseudooctadecabacter sp.]|uniref:hypothetical protein n=1 Tax=Pseudooctadecabacter sp. TaxID=1966338 RepID=UPI0035C87444